MGDETVSVSDSDSVTPDSESSLNGRNNESCKIQMNNYSFDVLIKKNVYKPILKDITIGNGPGSFLAIMGASGSGKSTLLNSLARRNVGRETGEVLYNSLPLNHTELQHSNILRYVMCSDCHLGFLTVHEAMMYSAKLKFRHLSKTELIDHVESLLYTMDLHSVRNNRIGNSFSKGLSSGEMRRLSIAMELIDNPEVILLDEPTSGLDSRRALSLVPILRNLAKESNKNVVVTIHQPSSAMFQLFDTVAFMANGRIFYWGPAKGVMTYINAHLYKLERSPYTRSTNPADFVLDFIASTLSPNLNDDADDVRDNWVGTFTLTQSEVEQWCDDYAESETYKSMRTNIESMDLKPIRRTAHDKKNIKTRFTEIGILTERFLINSIRNPMEGIFLVFFSALLGLFLGSFFYQSVSYTDVPLSPTSEYISEWISFVFSEYHPLPDALKDSDTVPIGIDGNPLPNAPAFSTYMENTTVKGVDYSRGIYKKDESGSYIVDNGNPVLEFSTETSNDIVYNFDDFPIKIPTSMDDGIATIDCIRNSLMDISDLYKDALDIDSRYIYWDLPPVPTEYEDEFTTARKAISIGYRAMVLVDFVFNKIDRTDLPGYDLYDPDGAYVTVHGDKLLIDDFGKLGMYYWVKTMACYGKEVNALLQCVNFPALPDLTVPEAQTLFKVYDLDTTCERVTGSVGAVKGQTRGSNLKDSDTEYDPDAPGTEKLTLVATNALRVLQDLGECDTEECHSFSTVVQDLKSDLVPQLVDALIIIFHTGGLLLFMVILVVFASFDGLIGFQQERVMFNRETHNGMYRDSSYYIARNIANLPFNYAHTTILFIIYYFLIGFELTKFWIFLAMFMSVIWSSYGFNYMFATLSRSLNAALMVVPLAVVISIVTTGFFIREQLYPAWIGWLKYFSFSRWGFQGMFIIQYPPGDSVGIMPNEWAAVMSGIEDATLAKSFSILIAMGFIYRVFGFLGLKYFHRHQGLEN